MARFSEEQFKFAVSNIELSERSIELAFLELVKDQKRSSICTEHNVTRQWMKSVIDRIEVNFNKRLIDNGLMYMHSIVEPDDAKQITKMEARALKSST